MYYFVLTLCVDRCYCDQSKNKRIGHQSLCLHSVFLLKNFKKIIRFFDVLLRLQIEDKCGLLNTLWLSLYCFAACNVDAKSLYFTQWTKFLANINVRSRMTHYQWSSMKYASAKQYIGQYINSNLSNFSGNIFTSTSTRFLTFSIYFV